MSYVKRWFRWQRLLLIVAGIPVSLIGSWFLYYVLVPDPCHYHQGKYLGTERLPAWIRLFFPPVDAMQHPEPNSLYFVACVVVGLALTTYAVHIMDKLKQQKETRHLKALDPEKAGPGIQYVAGSRKESDL